MKLPTDSERIFVTGKTGSGKTYEGLWQLSQRSIDERPWILVDFKRDSPINELPVSGHTDLESPPPRDPGLYIVQPTWEDAEPGGALDKYLRQVLEQGRTGVFIDEGQRMGQRSRGLRTILTEGRQPEVPLIFLTQRPVNVDTYAISESDYLQIFLLTHPDDLDRMHKFIPEDRLNFQHLRTLGPHHSYLYDVRSDELEVCAPCPNMDTIYGRILTRLPVFEDPPDDVPNTLFPRRVRV